MNLKYYTMTQGTRGALVRNLESFGVRVSLRDLLDWCHPFPTSPKEGVYVHREFYLLLEELGFLNTAEDWSNVSLVVLQGLSGMYYVLVPKDYASRFVIMDTVSEYKSYPGVHTLRFLQQHQDLLSDHGKQTLTHWENTEIIGPAMRLRLSSVIKRISKALLASHKDKLLLADIEKP